MTNKIFILCFALLLPSHLIAGEKEHKAILSYFITLDQDVERLQHWRGLSLDFKYSYVRNNKKEVLNLNDELESIKRLSKVVLGEGLGQLDFFDSLSSNPARFHIKFTIFFNDLPKSVFFESISDPFFWGAMVEIDEILLVTLNEGGEIVRIEEELDKTRKNKMTFGYLKSLFLKSRLMKQKGTNQDELRDKESGELLMIRIPKSKDTLDFLYYWPNGQAADNINQ